MQHFFHKSRLALVILTGSAISLCVTQTLALQQDAPPATRASDRPIDVNKPVRVATWNIESWRDHFEGFRRKGERNDDLVLRERLQQERYQNEEDLWEIAEVFKDPQFSPDVLVFQEGAAQNEVDEFNQEWLDGAYETVHVFPGNSDRGQTLGIMVKPGFKVLQMQESYREMPDTDDVNPRSDYLFARGPAFVLIESPSGFRFWVGTTHQKSKGGNSVEVTKWRNAEAMATRKIMDQLRQIGPEEVILLGDMNDELGVQAYELEGGGDVITNLVGPDDAGFELITRDVSLSGQNSFMGYNNDRYRSFIDHIVVTDETTDNVVDVAVYDTPWARVASDHLPVYVDLKPNGAAGAKN